MTEHMFHTTTVQNNWPWSMCTLWCNTYVVICVLKIVFWITLVAVSSWQYAGVDFKRATGTDTELPFVIKEQLSHN